MKKMMKKGLQQNQGQSIRIMNYLNIAKKKKINEMLKKVS
jgi:hypothetical protein